jgi:hypothetical protein
MRGRGRSRIAAKFAFLDDPLMRLVAALDAILTIIAFGFSEGTGLSLAFPAISVINA